MKLDLRALLAGDRYLAIDYELPLDTQPTDVYSFLCGTRFPSPMKVKGDITNTAGYMQMRLTLSVDYITPCARCLRPVSGSFSLNLLKTVAPRNLLDGLPEDKLDDFAVVEDGFLNMDEQLLEQLEMEFPVRFLCRDDCKGLCPQCGKDLNEGACDCSAEQMDPRLEPLRAILERMKEKHET